MRAACTGFQTLRHLHFAALEWITVTPLCNPVIPLYKFQVILCSPVMPP